MKVTRFSALMAAVRVALASSMAMASGCARPVAAPPDFVHTLGAERPEAGRIIDARSRRPLTPDALVERLRSSEIVLVGEKHDNLDHHAIEAWLIARLSQRPDGSRLQLVMEIFETAESDAIGDFLEAHPGNVSAVLQRFGWGRSDRTLAPTYQPVLEAAAARRVPILGGDLEEATRKAIGLGGPPPPELASSLERALAEPDLAAMQQRIRDSHCGHAPEAYLSAMVTVQRARDAQLARSVEAAAARGPVLLVAGGEHVRSDVGVPFYLEDRARALTVGLREVASEPAADLDDASAGRFDFVWTTPRVDDEDPCERFRRELEKLRAPEATGR